MVGNQKFFKGYTVGNNQKEVNLDSYDLTDNCVKYERDPQDTVMDITLKFDNHNIEGENIYTVMFMKLLNMS